MSVYTGFIQMLIVLLLMLVGFASRRRGLISDENNKCLSSLVLNVFNPAIIFSSMVSNQDGAEQGFWMGVFWVAALAFALLIALALPTERLFGHDRTQRKMYELMFVFSNMGFIGIPVIKALFGAEYVIYVAVFILEYNILIYTYGVTLLDEPSHRRFSLKSLRPLLNMGTLSCVAALVVFLGGVELPEAIVQTVSYLGDAATPLSLMVIGVSLGAQTSLLPVFAGAKKYLFCLFKMIIFPLVVGLVLKQLGIPETLCEISTILCAMPVGTMPLILVANKGLDEKPCSDAIMLTTLVSVATVPCVIGIYPYLPVIL